MQRTALLKAAGLLTALPLAMLPVKASAGDHCPPAYGHSGHAYSQGHHGSRHAMVWPGDAHRVGAHYYGGHTRHAAQPVVFVRVHRVAPVVVYRSHAAYSHGGYSVRQRHGYHD